MTLKEFFKTFELSADAPNAVGKMRELILELAVSGKLCSSSDIIWEEAALGSVIQLISGQHLLANEHNPDRNGIPYLTGPSDFGRTYPIPTRWTQQPKIVAHPGDILVTVKGSGVGKTNLLLKEPTAIGRQLMAVRVIAADTGFVHIVLKRAAAHFQNAMSGIAIPGIGRKDILNFRIALPPLAEQKRIVAKVDELMALCDQLEAQQQERETRHAALVRASLSRFAEAPTPANLNLLFHRSYNIPPAELRKSILTLAVQGKLVPQCPEDEPVLAGLGRCLAERRHLQRTSFNSIRLLSPQQGLGYSIPATWVWQALEDLLTFGPTNGCSPKSVEYETGIRSLTLTATTSGRFKGEHSKFVDLVVPSNSDLWLRDGDVLVQRGNTLEYVGVAAVYWGKSGQFIYPDLMMKLRFSEQFDISFLHLAMSEESARNYLRSRASGTAGTMPKINQTALKSLPLPIPPLPEQRRIVAKVDELMALVDTLETQLAESRTKAAELMEAVVAELTSGR